MDLAIKTFYTVANLGSFSKAAEAMYISQSAVSYTIKKLEKEIGVELFERKSNTVCLTPAGEVLFEYAQEYLNKWEELKEELNKYNNDSAGTLKIGVASLISDNVIQVVLQQIKQKVPGIDIIMIVGNSHDLMEKMRNNEIDFAFVSEPIVSDNYCVIPFCDDELVLIVNPHHPWTKLPSISCEDLKSMPYISREEGSGGRKIIEANLKEIGIIYSDLNIAFTVGSTDAVKHVVENGKGFSFVSAMSVQKEVENGMLHTVKVDNLIMKRKFILVNKKSTLRTKFKKLFFDEIVDITNTSTE